MHFSSSAGAGTTMADKMASAIRACGYDVLHGCCTALIGVLVISFVPGEAFRIFGYLSMVMCAYGGLYALWCLPCMLILADAAIQAVAPACGRRGGSTDAAEAVDPALRTAKSADDIVAIVSASDGPGAPTSPPGPTDQPASASSTAFIDVAIDDGASRSFMGL